MIFSALSLFLHSARSSVCSARHANGLLGGLHAQQLLTRGNRHFGSVANRRSKVVFLGTPSVAASVLESLVAASRHAEATFEVVAVVTKAPANEGHSSGHLGKQGQLQQVHKTALDLGFAASQIFTPGRPKEAGFLESMAEISPDLCITAAYGGMLPQQFLDIPRCGTLNIHPSLLPRHRGAAPVQRTLEHGDPEAGVSLVYTVLQCDAGPVLERASVPLHGDEQAPELMSRLFELGTAMLLNRMGDILSCRGRSMAREQDHAQATYARKVTREEGILDLSLAAEAVHNKVRALAGWPGTRVDLLLADVQAGTTVPIQVPIVRTKVVLSEHVPKALQRQAEEGGAAALPQGNAPQRVHYVQGRVLVPCGGHSLLEVLEVEARSSKRAGVGSKASAQEFMRSLGRKCRLFVPPWPTHTVSSP